MMTAWKEIDQHVKVWMNYARKLILAQIKTDVQVSTKSGPNDLVTNVDKEIEEYYVKQIKLFFPNSLILGEEGHKDSGMLKHQGYFWVIDPIDGTMNFVKEQENFASMIAIYYNGKPLLGYIYDVMKDKLFWGGPACQAVYCNNEKLNSPANLSLKDGLFGASCPMVLRNYRGINEVISKSSGARIVGSAGIEFINVMSGKLCAYLSFLRPWDYLPGKILAETLGLIVKTIDGEPVNVLSSTDVLVATDNAQSEIFKIINNY